MWESICLTLAATASNNIGKDTLERLPASHSVKDPQTELKNAAEQMKDLELILANKDMVVQAVQTIASFCDA
ncbi:hypothetical protein AXX17_AT3G35220 [Arabidopsis thaliana]|uniref:Uncharacterized protein n=1 Tax=Arabidopsis thaliana TaxID=3702 RepID=A0A178VG25_ARATH|nr:hypothetical protein AXX17_AT3G35220 [Arabidopsis thaliana]